MDVSWVCPCEMFSHSSWSIHQVFKNNSWSYIMKTSSERSEQKMRLIHKKLMKQQFMKYSWKDICINYSWFHAQPTSMECSWRVHRVLNRPNSWSIHEVVFIMDLFMKWLTTLVHEEFKNIWRKFLKNELHEMFMNFFVHYFNVSFSVHEYFICE